MNNLKISKYIYNITYSIYNEAYLIISDPLKTKAKGAYHIICGPVY